MIIVLVKYNCKPGCREQFLDAIRENKIDELSRTEVGNHRYEYSYSIDKSDVLILNELWENEDVLKAHSQAEHFKALGELKAKYVESAEIVKYEGNQI